MKKISFIVFSFACILFISVPFRSDAAFLQPFGGRVYTAPTPGVTCPAGKEGSPFTVLNLAAKGAPLLMVGDYHPTSSTSVIAPSVWILGLYNPIALPECQTTSTPPVTVPGFRTFFHGTSLRLSV
jgi:hypothetical protein